MRRITKENIILILIVVVAVIVTILVISMFRKRPAAPEYKQLIEAQDKIIEAKQQVIDAMDKSNERLDATIASYESKDSLLIVALANNQQKYKANDTKMSQVRKSVIDLDKEQLRGEVSRYSMSGDD